VPAVPALHAARIDTALSIAVGGVVTASIMVAAAAIHAPGTEINTAGAMARQLEPALGASAEMFFLLGLLAAGVTSAATAPLAAAYAAGGCLGWPDDLRDPRMRRVGMAVLGCGAALAVWGHKPLAVIVGAQALNGLLLPLIALFLLIASNQTELLGGFRNRFSANVGAGLVVTLTFVLAVWQLLRAWDAL
jgi:manganese transport protein